MKTQCSHRYIYINKFIYLKKKKSKASAKLHVGNISPTCTNQELWARLEEHGSVIECDIVKDYAFVHVERTEDAVGLSGALTTQSFKAHERTCSCPPAGFGLLLGWETRVAAVSVGRRGTGQKSAQ